MAVNKSETSEAREWQSLLDGAVHDLRAALRGVRTSAEILVDACEDVARAREVIPILLDSVDKIEALSKRLSNYSRAVTADTTEGFGVSLETALHSATQELQPLIRESTAEIQHAPFPRILVNHDVVVTLLRETISNAIQFRSSLPPRIEIVVTPEGEYWRFAVSDNGLGIEPQFWETVFLPFQRLHSNTKSIGLGLAICRKVVTAQGGAMWVQAELGSGSTFFFTLPASGGAGS